MCFVAVEFKIAANVNLRQSVLPASVMLSISMTTNALLALNLMPTVSCAPLKENVLHVHKIYLICKIKSVMLATI